MPIYPIIVALVVGGGILLLFVGFLQTLQQESEFEQRLDSAMGRRATVVQATAVEGGASTGLAVAAAVEKALVKRGYGTKVRENLSRADHKLTVGEFMIGSG